MGFFLSPATGKMNYISLQFGPAVHVQVEQIYENEFGEGCAHGGICSRLYREGNFPRPARLQLLLDFRGKKSGQCRDKAAPTPLAGEGDMSAVQHPRSQNRSKKAWESLLCLLVMAR